MTEIAPVPRLTGAHLVYGGSESLHALAEVADSATTSLDIDLFHGEHKETLKTLTRKRPGVDKLFLLDPEVSDKVRAKVAKAGGMAVDTGAMPAKNHVKALVADGQRGIVSTASIGKSTPKRFDIAATFDGASAGALHDLSRATATGDTAAITAAAKAARTHGIVVNDAAHGVWQLSDEVYDMVGSAKHTLEIATKRFQEPRLKQMVRDAKARGVNVTVGKRIGRGDVPLHANVVIADDARAYIGSGHLSRRVLTGGGKEGRLSREMGIILEDTGLISDVKSQLVNRGFLKAARGDAKVANKLLSNIEREAAGSMKLGSARGLHGVVGGLAAAAGIGALLLSTSISTSA